MRHEFTVTSPEHFGASAQPIQDVISTAINEAVERGFVLVLLSPASFASRWVKHETEYAFQLTAPVAGEQRHPCRHRAVCP